MRLLFDENLSAALCARLADLFPDSSQVRLLGLAQANDSAIWERAKADGFAIVSLDAEFADMAALYGAPPKVIWLRCGNQPAAIIERLLRRSRRGDRVFRARRRELSGSLSEGVTSSCAMRSSSKKPKAITRPMCRTCRAVSRPARPCRRSSTKCAPLRLVQAFAAIEDQTMRRALLALTEGIARLAQPRR